MRTSHPIRALALAATLALAALPATAGALRTVPPPIEGPGCRYLEKGPPGPRGNVLLIERGESVGVRREGEAVEVVHRGGLGSVIDCEGRQATVHDIDRIVYRPTNGGHQLTIDESGGLLAPGATPEPGGDEIEVYADFPRAHGYISSGVRVQGTSGPDWMRIGRLRGDRTGIDLDVSHDGAHPDVDVFSHAVSRGHYTLDGRAGEDRLSSSGRGPELLGPLPEGSDVLRGGAGDDLLLGGPRKDVIRGEAGADRIYGRGGEDRIDPGPGADRVHGGRGADLITALAAVEEDGIGDLVYGGPGDDSIAVVNGNPDRVECGGGRRDQLQVDALDVWNHATCEKVHGPGAP
jgi:Ca2+-binding RTX toxin-like protein